MPAEIILNQLTANAIPDNPDEVRLFAVVRDEMTRLQYFMDYYKALGINRFFFVDNSSTDGTVEFLLQQENCHVFQTPQSFREANYGVKWLNSLLDTYGTGHWCLTVDADELLVWPDKENTSVQDLTHWLDSEGVQGLYTFMLDMYSEGPLSKTNYVPGTSFLEACPMFDNDYIFRPRLHLRPWRKPLFPRDEVIGGPRLRIFYSDQKNRSIVTRIVLQIFWNFALRLSQLGLFDKRRTPHPAPTLFKIPLVKWYEGAAYKSSTHLLCAPLKLSSITGVLLHFKFFSDFHEKSVRESMRGEHYGGGFEYKRYLDALSACKGEFTFNYSGTSRFSNTKDLISRGLIKTSEAYKAYRARIEEECRL